MVAKTLFILFLFHVADSIIEIIENNELLNIVVRFGRTDI